VARLGEDDRRRIETQVRLAASVREQVGPLPVPYFGHMRLHTGLRETDVLLGYPSKPVHGFALIDWQNAPLAEVFFSVDEGDAYEVEVGDRLVTGRLLEKNVVTFEGGAPVRILTPDGTLRREQGEWRRTPERLPPLAPRPASARRPFRSPLDVELDAVQKRAVDLPADRSLLLLGEAGFGKTTVALHRLVELRARAGRRFHGSVVVPTEGLRRLTKMMLERRGVTDVDVWTYERLAARLGRIFRDLPRRLSVNTPTRVSRLKRHPALRPVLEAFVRAHPRPLRDEEVTVKNRALASRADLLHLFGDRTWMAKVIEASQGALPFPTVAEVAEHTRIQFLDPTEVAMAHVDAEQLATVDGASIDEGTPLEDARSFDFEDVAVLFELDRLRAIAAGAEPVKLGNYHCLLVDEAQEFAPLELSLMGRAVRARGTVIVAGDAAQQVDPTTHFAGWDDVLEELGAPGAERTTLRINYRCPPDVTELARAVIDPRRRPVEDRTIARVRVDTPLELTLWLTEALRDLVPEDPQASIALVTRSSEAARALARWLRHGTPVHLALEGDFPFRPGPLVTSVLEVKGLEFDHVVLPDASAATYPDTAESRRSLYVALTRATHRLTLAAAGSFSPVLPPPP
jgi:DNA helicase-2/ATP-dependent DNA helicase PcrA